MLIDDALAGHDPRVVVSLHTAPKDDDPFAIETIKKANPAFNVFLNPREVLAMAADARRMPAREPEFRNLVLNQRVEALNPFIKPAQWKACAGKVAKLEGREVYAGLDLSETADLTALVVIGQVDDLWHVQPNVLAAGEGAGGQGESRSRPLRSVARSRIAADNTRRRGRLRLYCPVLEARTIRQASRP